MHKILLDGVYVESLVPESLPMLIHGEEGSGASLYTICLAAKWFSQRYKILFLCGYPMAEAAFAQEVGGDYPDVQFFTKEKVDAFLDCISDPHENTIIIVKNIELFERDVLEAVSSFNNIIISGDVSKSAAKAELLKKKFTTEIYFSLLDGKELPVLEKYHGYVESGDFKGATSLQ